MYTHNNDYYNPHHLNHIGQGGKNLLSLNSFKYLTHYLNILYDLGFCFSIMLGRRY